jgi:hypothetical protein
MTLCLYLDEDSQDRFLVRALRARAIDVVTAFDVDMIEREDSEQIEWATAHNRAIYSFNIADFYGLHTIMTKEGKSHGGIILARQQQYSVGEQMRRLLKLISAKSADEMRGQVEFLSAWG